MKKISILGSTGSIGTQSLEVISACGMKVEALTAHSDVVGIEEQCRKFHPQLAVMTNAKAAADLKIRLADTDILVVGGEEGLVEAATLPDVDTVITAVVGIVGLVPTLAAIDEKKRIALANKETLVCGGELVMDRGEALGVDIIPVDSEHSALFQCLQGCNDTKEVKRLILTASGGPFFGYTKEQIEKVTLAQALKHPNWSMGAKITVDSATLMNKGLEFIEAMRLYRMAAEDISIVVHRESIIHSLVEYCDGSMLAQMGAPDMRLPIQYALTYPKRMEGVAKPLDLLTCPNLTFAPPDQDVFPCLALAKEAARIGGTTTAILNGANEVAVARFLAGEIAFTDIPKLVEAAMTRISPVPTPTLEDILQADCQAREVAQRALVKI